MSGRRRTVFDGRGTVFVKGDQSTVDDEARQWMRDRREIGVLPFAGSHGVPDNFLADRPNVAEEHYDGTRPIEQDVRRITGRDLLQWRSEWLQALGKGS